MDYTVEKGERAVRTIGSAIGLSLLLIPLFQSQAAMSMFWSPLLAPNTGNKATSLSCSIGGAVVTLIIIHHLRIFLGYTFAETNQEFINALAAKPKWRICVFNAIKAVFIVSHPVFLGFAKWGYKDWFIYIWLGQGILFIIVDILCADILFGTKESLKYNSIILLNDFLAVIWVWAIGNGYQNSIEILTCLMVILSGLLFVIEFFCEYAKCFWQTVRFAFIFLKRSELKTA